jgi:ATP-dependent exoDNAse (exonuclease V) beta subunit
MKLLAKNLLILASAGSGKTYQLGNRVIGLVARGGAPERIVALTFTRKAAGEFADSVLSKLAAAAADDGVAARLRGDLQLPGADFADALERVVRALPSLTLGTMDSFFAKVVRGFPYELGLTGGRFDLLEGPRAAAATDELLAGVLGGGFLMAEDGEEFFHAFRRATIGREDQGVLAPLREFIAGWQEVYRAEQALVWGPENLAEARPEDWPNQRASLAEAVMQGIDALVFTDRRQREALEKTVRGLADHSIGSGSLAEKSTMRDAIFAAVAAGAPPLALKFHQPFTIDGPAGEALHRMVVLAARCEFAAALQRTRAVRDVVAAFDAVCERRLRSNGMLQFNDVKLLMGEWARGEDARLRRESVDFRLDARIDHWLLDEFQDTSRADWTGLLPLIDEAATGDEGTMFIVGDRKQAIYAWRGGDVRLFDEVVVRYGDGLATASMEESWRSCPEVLELVNRVCGDLETLHALFGEASRRWEWRDHVAAQPLRAEQHRGEARVEVVGDFEQRLARLVEILTETGVGVRAMTCGVLLRGNDKVRRVADALRAHGFDVIEEGRRLPAMDNPVGIAISHLLQWLADPANTFAREVLEMSPLAAQLRARHGDSWRVIWEALTDALSRDGFARTIGATIAGLWPSWSDFGRRRAGDLLGALAALDARGGVSAAGAADWIARLEVSQNPGVAAVQVMTIHKAKGLGFDLVVLPEIPDRPLPEAQHFDIAEGAGWLSETPAKWVRDLIPELREAEQRWTADQRYEGFCMLYVALTRAKRGLYVLLDTPPQKPDPAKASLANWLARALAAAGGQGLPAGFGAAGWSENIAPMPPENPPVVESPPGPAIPRRGRMSPSAAKSQQHAPKRSPGGMRFGSEVHALLEHVAWTDDSFPELPPTEAGQAVAKLLRNPALAAIFEKRGRNVDLFREQATDAILDDCLMSGVIDRLHLHRNAAGEVDRVEIIDYKTDAVIHPEELAGRYAGQMEAYRAALRLIHPAAQVTCVLLSVRHGVAVPLA